MNIKYLLVKKLMLILAIGSVIVGCQKMDRPELGELILDPPPPPYSTLKNYFAFEENAGDSGQFRMGTTVKNVSYVDGINGKAVKIGEDGYILQAAVNDSMKTPGSLSVAFWMNGAGPVVGGAQGLFSISNKTKFWGNFDIFLENNDNGSEAFLKVHMDNFTNSPDNGEEEWAETKIANALNKWTHIAVTYDAATSQISIYADGQPTAIHNKQLKGGAYGSLTYKNVNGVVIGNYQFETSPSLTDHHGKEDWAKSFNGALDQFRIYNVALTAEEVQNLFNSKE